MAASVCSIIDSQNLYAIFSKKFQMHQLKSKEIKKERARFDISDRGDFKCLDCNHAWSSNFSWLTIDLELEEITYRWKMKCKACMGESCPSFTKSQLESMIEKAVLKYKGERFPERPNKSYGGYRQFSRPHVPELCEKCGWGTGPCCWLSVVRY